MQLSFFLLFPPPSSPWLASTSTLIKCIEQAKPCSILSSPFSFPRELPLAARSPQRLAPRRLSRAPLVRRPPPTGRAPRPPPVRGRVLHRHLERRCVVNAIQRPRRPRVVSCVVLRDINVFIGGSRPPHCMGTARGDTTKHVCEMLKSQVHAVHTCICATR